jgi:hypothetical protein
MLIHNLEYLESTAGLTIEGGKAAKATPAAKPAKTKPAAVVPGTATAGADALSEAFGPFTSTYGVAGASTTPFSALSTASVRSTSSNSPIVK